MVQVVPNLYSQSVVRYAHHLGPDGEINPRVSNDCKKNVEKARQWLSRFPTAANQATPNEVYAVYKTIIKDTCRDREFHKEAYSEQMMEWLFGFHLRPRDPLGNNDEAQSILQNPSRVSVMTQYEAEDTILHYASQGANSPVIELLLNAGADITATTRIGWTPLHYAVIGKNTGALAALIDAGASVEAAPGRGSSPLNFAVLGGDLRVVGMLLEAEASITGVVGGNGISFFNAIDRGDTDVVRMLLDAGANVNGTDNRGNTPLHRATQAGRGEIVTLLFEREAQGSIGNQIGETPLYLAHKAGHETIVEQFMGQGIYDFFLPNTSFTVWAVQILNFSYRMSKSANFFVRQIMSRVVGVVATVAVNISVIANSVIGMLALLLSLLPIRGRAQVREFAYRALKLTTNAHLIAGAIDAMFST